MGNFFDILGGIGLFLIIFGIFLLIIIIRLICAIFEMNDNIRDIREIIVRDYNEKHSEENYTRDQKHIACKEKRQDENLY